MLSTFEAYIRWLFTSQPVAAWTAVLALITTLAIVIPLFAGFFERKRVDETCRLLLVLMLRTMRNRLDAFDKDVGSPGEQHSAGMDLLISRAFSVDVARSLNPEILREAYDVAIRAYGRMVGAVDYQRKGLHSALRADLYELKQLVDAVILKIDPHYSPAP
jgi:hypothetical protein